MVMTDGFRSGWVYLHRPHAISCLNQRAQPILDPFVQCTRLDQSQFDLLLNSHGRRSLALGRFQSLAKAVLLSQAAKTSCLHQVRFAIAGIEPGGPRKPVLCSADRPDVHPASGHLPSPPGQDTATEERQRDNRYDDDHGDHHTLPTPGSIRLSHLQRPLWPRQVPRPCTPHVKFENGVPVEATVHGLRAFLCPWHSTPSSLILTRRMNKSQLRVSKGGRLTVSRPVVPTY